MSGDERAPEKKAVRVRRVVEVVWFRLDDLLIRVDGFGVGTSEESVKVWKVSSCNLLK